MKGSGVAVLQGSDGSIVDHQVSQLAHCSVPIGDTKIYPHKFVRTDAVHCQICGGKMRKWCCYVTFAIKDSTLFALALLWEVFQIRGGGVRNTRWHFRKLSRVVVIRCMVIILDVYFGHGTIFWHTELTSSQCMGIHKLAESCVPDILNPRSCFIGMNNRLG